MNHQQRTWTPRGAWRSRRRQWLAEPGAALGGGYDSTGWPVPSESRRLIVLATSVAGSVDVL